LGLWKTVLPEPIGGSQAPAAVVAMNHDSRIAMRREFGDALRKFLHGNQHRPVDPHQRIFIRLAAIDEQQIIAGIPRRLNRATIDLDR
jgi:hypothetical protein